MKRYVLSPRGGGRSDIDVTLGWRSSTRRLAIVLVLSVGAMLAQPGQAQEFEWARSAGSADEWDSGSGIAVDASGNSYVTGRFRDTATFGPFTLYSAGYDDIFVAKYDGSGTVLWAQRAGSAESPPQDASERGREIAVDGVGNSYVTGNFLGTATFGPFALTSAGKDDVFLAKYDPSGTILWVRSAQGTGLDKGAGVALDGLGNIYVTGRFADTVTFTPFTLTSPTGSSAIFVVKYDSTGNVVWARTSTSVGWAHGHGIAADASGNSYVVASYGGTPTFGAFTLPPDAGGGDVVVLKYDAAGNVLWARTGGGSLLDFPTAIAVDASRNSHITGWFAQGGFGVGTATFGAFTLTSSGESDVFVVKYDGAGNVLWAESGGGGSSDYGSGIAVDASGNSYLTGTFADVVWEVDLTATFGPITLTSAGYSEVFLAKYDVDGNVVWAKSAGGSGNDGGSGIAVDPTGNNNYMTGYFRGTATFAPLAVTAAGVSADIFVAKLSDTPAATCSPDADDDGIQDGVDELPSTYSNSFVDTSTDPDTRGGYTQRGDQDLCASDAPGSDGVYVESLGTLGGGSTAAQVQLTCLGGGFDTEVKRVDAGDCITLTCRSGPTAEIRNSCPTSAASAGAAGTTAQIAAVRDVDVDLLAVGLVVATLVLPEGNSISYNPETLEVTAGASNNTTLILITAPGEQQPLAPGASTTLPPPAAIPAVSQWGLIALTLVLLVGAKVYFGRRRTMQA